MNHSQDSIPKKPIFGWPPDPPPQVVKITADLQKRADHGEDVQGHVFQWKRNGRFVELHWWPKQTLIDEFGGAIAAATQEVAAE